MELPRKRKWLGIGRQEKGDMKRLKLMVTWRKSVSGTEAREKKYHTIKWIYQEVESAQTYDGKKEQEVKCRKEAIGKIK